MSSFRNRSHSEDLGMPETRTHCVRIRRVMVRKQQMLRRERRLSSVYDSSTEGNAMYHHAKHSDLTRTLSSSSTFRSESGLISSHRRHNLATERRLFPSQPLGHYREGACTLLSGGDASPFSVGNSAFQCDSSDAPQLLPLPPVVQRINMAGSPFSPYSPNDIYDLSESSFQQLRHQRAGPLFSDARAHSSGGGGSGGGGGDGGATASGGASPGGGDMIDGETPSEYTFRRRNAIVEGSEDAPKADDFPNSSP
ncbi:hypothetical protein BGZ51_009401, partial [Haplosporangium sp. Z 767]